MGVLKSVLGNSGLRISSLTKVSLVPALHLLPPSTPFWPHGTDPFFSTCPNHVNTLWSALLANSLSIQALLRTIRDTPIKLLKDFISRTFTFLLSALLMPHPSALYNAVGTITPSCRHFAIYPQSSIAQHTFQRSPRSTLLIQCIPFTSSITFHLRPQVFKTIHFI